MNRLLLISVLAMVLFSGCVVVAPQSHRHGPRDNAPAYGHHSQYRYYYYPDAAVYYDPDRDLYFYLDDGWRSAERLPIRFLRLLGDRVLLSMDSARPYSRYGEHRKAYPSRKKRSDHDRHDKRHDDRYDEDRRW